MERTKEGKENLRQKYLKQVKKVVVKLGTSILAPGASLNLDLIRGIAEEVSELKRRSIDVVLVTSGAIGTGMGLLKLKSRPKSLPMLQAAAAIGQSHLMKAYDDAFRSKHILSAQILLTADDMTDRKRYLNARNTILALTEQGAVPIINENDTVSTEEIKFGDNDKLSALVANVIDADLLLVLTDTAGFYHKDKLQNVVERITPDIEKSAAGSKAELTLGGMLSKIQAAKIVTASGIPMVVADGRKEKIIEAVMRGDDIGTIFLPSSKLAARKRWLAFTAKPKGTIVVDQGAKVALIERGKSLLASGIKDLRGEFEVGDIVTIVGEDNKEFAKGLVDYSSKELQKIKGKKTSEIEAVLGYKYYDEVVHRDNMVIL